MNALEQHLTYPFGTALPAPAARLPVAPGVDWIRMPLPFQLDHINLWLLRDRDEQGTEGWTLVDCGVASDEIRALWTRLFDEGLDGLPILRLLCTHTHPDHVGLAHWLQQRFPAPLWMTMGEYGLGRVLSSRLPGADAESARAHYRRHGIGAGPQLDAFAERGGSHFSRLVPSMPTHFRRIRDGERLVIGDRQWRVIVGLGHSPEHAALYCERDALLLSGDMVLPRISTNVSVWEIEPLSNPVDWYLDSLGRFETCREDTLVLPSHGRPFRGLHTRIQQLRDHHHERLDTVLKACRREPLTAAEVVPVMFEKQFDTHQLAFALGEALAHLHSLWYSGRVRRTIDGQGVIRFAA